MSVQAPPRPRFRDVFAVREFRAVWFSEILSVAGDRLALVALTLLVFDRTKSPLLAAIVYAMGYLPWVIGGLCLTDLADRRPRRQVMVACDAARAVLVAAMAMPGVPLLALVALLFATTMFTPPFESARAAVTPDILHGELYILGAAVTQTTFLAAQVAGAVGGGVAVVFIGTRPALATDSATFVLSGLLIAFGLRARPAARPDTVQSSPWARTREGFRLVFGDRALRTLLGFGWLVAFYTVPEGVAAPYTARLGGGPIATGLVLASTALATTIVTPLFIRFVRARQRLALMGPLATAACAALVLTTFRPGLAASLVIFSVSAVFGSYQIAANTAFVVRVPNERRSQAFGIANMGVVVGQGAGFVAAGAASEVLAPATVIAIGGGIGAIAALILALRWRQGFPATGRHAAQRTIGDAVDPRQQKARKVAPSANGLLTATVRLLPADHRNRYRQEYRSELLDLAQAGAGRIGQLRYAFRQLRSAPQMWFTLRSPRRRGAMP
jgi:MFS family permease